MIKVFTSFIFSVFICCSLNAQIGINTESPDPSASLDIEGTSRGFLPPRLSKDDRAILDGLGATNGPATGLVIYNKSDSALQVNKGSKSVPNWVSLGAGGSSSSSDVTWFYLPVTPISMTSGIHTLDLYAIYENQLKNKLSLPYTKDQLEFIILGYDTSCFTTCDIVDYYKTGYSNILLYAPRTSAVTDASYLNIAIKVTK